MRILGFDITRAADQHAASTLSSVGARGWWPLVRESFSGAWQRNVTVERGDLLTYPTLYACMASVSQDIGILPFTLRTWDTDGVSRQITSAAYDPVLRKPNHYQTPQQFREAWQLSKLGQGNAYILKQRDNRGVVQRLYVLDPWRVVPLVAESGDVYYQLWLDELGGLPPGLQPGETLTVPAREIIHDREATLHHRLIGIPPLAAAYWPAVKNMQILTTAARFFGNGATPGGILTAPGAIAEKTAERLEAYWNENFTGENAGRVAVVGDGLKYEPMGMKATDAQMVEQMRYSDEQICQAFRVPPFIVGLGAIPAGMKADDMALQYYKRALQPRIEHMEALLDEGLQISAPMGVELDTRPLLRMDHEKQATVEAALVGGAIKTPNEARRQFELPPVTGGDTVYLQQQNYSLEALARRDAKDDPFAEGGGSSAPPEPPAEDTEAREAREQAARVQRRHDLLNTFRREMAA